MIDSRSFVVGLLDYEIEEKTTCRDLSAKSIATQTRLTVAMNWVSFPAGDFLDENNLVLLHHCDDVLMQACWFPR